MGFEMQPRPREPPSAKLPRPVESSEKARLDISCRDRQMNLRMTVEVLLYWVVGAAYLHLGPEEFTITNAMYYITVTITTVGYGDLGFTHGDTCRRFLVVFILSSVVLVTAGIKSLINISSELHAEAKEHRLLDSFDFELLKSMAMEGRHVGGVAKTDYILTMLRLMELVDEEKVALYGNMFDSYDKDGSGVLDDSRFAVSTRAVCSASMSATSASSRTPEPSLS